MPTTSEIEYRKTVLDNGLRLLAAPMPHTRSVAVNVFVGAGSRYEASAEAGVSHFLEHLAFKGTERRPTPRELSEAIEGVGGAMNAGTDRESTTYWSRVGRDHFLIAMDVLGDILLHSRLDPQDVEKERPVIQEELRMANDGPDERASLLLDELLWPDQPLGRDVGGTYDSVQRLSRSTIVDYYAQEYGPSNAIVVVAGSVSYEQAQAESERLFAEWTPAHPRPMIPCEAKLPSSPLKVEYRKTEQAHIAVGLAG
ncbi:MAG: insulinase family protein, partial [Chloroflexi bacterium]|nr:insulinase family protein [Chloroflexota bacterium]